MVATKNYILLLISWSVLIDANSSQMIKCNSSNDNCQSGEFCNQDDPNFCEKCYYPCDLDQQDAIKRYEDAGCGFCGISTPNSSPISPSSPSSSTRPTSCDKEIDREVKTNPDRKNPIILKPESIFVMTNAFCTVHENYTACTNENREDCQWVFLSGSPFRKGLCRVDPISKCIETGSCKCNTKDFQGGDTDLGKGILFHAPVSVTARDISSIGNTVSFTETYVPPTPDNQDPDHPQDETFFISRVNFSHRALRYTFTDESSIPSAMAEVTVAFKLHYLYMDMPLSGDIWSGLGLKITIDTSKKKHKMTINGNTYKFSNFSLKKWHCTQIIVTSSHLIVAGNIVERDLFAEKAPQFTSEINLGMFSGELFDVRVYGGTLSSTESDEVGARCTNPDNQAVLNLHKDVETPILRGGCDPDIDPIPTTGGQTYSSGPFATFWVAPIEDEFDENLFIDVAEGSFDEEHLFQQVKVQSYAWERWYFETDMIGFNQKPYRFYESADEVPGFSKDVWDNPCRYMHQHNNGWLFPFYGGDSIPKWKSEKNVFDLSYLFHNDFDLNYGFVIHETFHGMQGELADTYQSPYSRFFAESTASFGADMVFPATQTYTAPYALAHALPLNFFFDRDIDLNPHFGTTEISINDAVRGGHIYAAFLFWSFLSSQVGIPHIIGKMHSLEGTLFNDVFGGELLALRIFVESEGFDLGDLFGVFVAHLRTWDYPRFSDNYAKMEQNDFDAYSSNNEWPFPGKILEDFKTDVTIDPKLGTSGQLVSGPSSRRPGQFGWNCLTAYDVDAGTFVTIEIKWNTLGNDSSNPSELHEKQAGCDDDIRFYNSMIVAHNLLSGRRRYWKIKGKTPRKVVIDVGSNEPITIHILMIPTPPADYVDSQDIFENDLPFPNYSYKYSVQITEIEPAGGSTMPAQMENGIVKFESSGSDWWPKRCTCTVLDDDRLSGCSVPKFMLDECKNNLNYKFKHNGDEYSCKTLDEDKDKKIKKICDKKKSTRDFCPVTCDVCMNDCKDDEEQQFKVGKKNMSCVTLSNEKSKIIKNICKNVKKAKGLCPITCDSCSLPCVDDKKKRFKYEGNKYTCKKLRKENEKDAQNICKNEKKSRKICQATCKSC